MDENQVNQPASAENKPETPGAGKQDKPGKVTFTPEQQEALDRILDQRLARQKTQLEQQAEKTLNDRVQAIEAQLKAAELKALRLEVATKKGLSPALADRLRGESQADLEADADVLAGLMPKPQATPNPTGNKPPVSPANPAGNGSGWTEERIVNTPVQELAKLSDSEFKAALEAVRKKG